MVYCWRVVISQVCHQTHVSLTLQVPLCGHFSWAMESDIQTTASGDIWVSYFDEGVFGNTIGSAGLVRFDVQGEPTYKFQPYKFQPSVDLDPISDCYGLNVQSDNKIWFYYYTPFLLVQLHKEAVSFWKPGVLGASVFAVAGNQVVIHAGYQEDDWCLLRLHRDGLVNNMGPVEFVDENGDPLPARCAKARGRMIWFVRNSTIYRADISHLG